MTEFDAIVVGSGISGGWAAKELTEAGLRTLVLERGRNVEHVKDYPTATLDPWELPHGNRPTQKDLEEYHVQKDLYLFGQDSKHFLVKDSEHPYNAVKDFRWFRGYQVGGRSLLWARHCFRWSDLDFEANAKEGVGIDWPIRYKDIEPWYDRVETFIGVSGENAGLPQLPDGKLLPPFEMNCIERHFRDELAARYSDRRLISSRAAVLSQPHNGRGQCMGRNLCHRGCPYGAYFSSNSSTLPAAAATGRLTLRPHSIVHSVIADANTGKAKGVRVIDAETHATYRVLRPGDLSECVGAEHHRAPAELAEPAASERLRQLERRPRPLPDGPSCRGRGHGDARRLCRQVLLRPAQHQRLHPAVPQCLDARPEVHPRLCLRGLHRTPGMAGAKRRHDDDWRGAQGHADASGAVVDLHGSVRRVPAAAREPRVAEPSRRRTNGACRRSISTWRTARTSSSCGTTWKGLPSRCCEAAGFQSVAGYSNPPHPGEVIHEMGTARMGRDPKTSVLNAFNQCHDARNVFVTDGACMVSTACQNPSLTYMALTARACAYAVEQLKRGDL